MKRMTVCLTVVWLLVIAQALPATAQFARFYDRDGGGGTGIKSIEIQNGPANVVVSINHNRYLDRDVVWLDTVRHDRGPEYRLLMYANSDVGSYRRVEGFTRGLGHPWRCNGVRMSSDNFERGAWSYVRVPQSCLRGPGPVRVATDSGDEDTGAYDDAPDWGTYEGYFTPWLSRGD